MKKRSGTVIQRIRVPFGFFFGIVFLVFARPEPAVLIIGGIVAAIGILIRAWASGHIRKNQNLAVSGPYSYTRNPLYLGSFVLGVGFTIAAGVWWLGIVFIALFLGIYLPVMRAETGELMKLFGAEYEQYARRVPLFFPDPTARRISDAKFDKNLYMRHREYQAALGLIFAWLVLAFKTIFLR